jgi:hypothetical protein
MSVTRRGAVVAVVAGALGIGMLAPAGAFGTVTIGSNLGRAPTGVIGCGPSICTNATVVLPFAAQAPDGLVSRTNGTVVQWRILAGATVTPTSLRVIRNIFGIPVGAGTSATVTPVAGVVNTFATNLPIAIGDVLGIDCCMGAGANYIAISPGSIYQSWNPPLPDGSAGVTPASVPNSEVTINADIQPTSAFTVVKAQPKRGGKVALTVNLPNPGSLSVGDKNANVASAAAKKSKVKYLKRASMEVLVPGQTTLTVKPTAAARQVLSRQSRLKAKLKLVFTPNNGDSSTQVRKVKLRR